MTYTVPRLTTAEDVRWAFRVLRCTEVPEGDVDAIVRRCRSLPELRDWILESDGFNESTRHSRCGARKPDAEQVRWVYRLLRYTELAIKESERIAALADSLAVLVDGILADPADARVQAFAATRPGATVVFSKSMPRSGHHLLADMLLEYFGRDLAYCEFYREGCCRQQPCERASFPMLGNRFFIQKSHDLRSEDPRLPGHPYIVQYRHPITRLQSNWDHYVHVQGVADTESAFRSFAHAETAYFIRFWKRWVTDAPPRCLILAYESLVDDARGTVIAAVRLIDPGAAIRRDALDRAVGIVGRPATSSLQDADAFRLRDARAYRYQLPELYANLEARTFATCRGLDLPLLFG